MSDSPHPVSRVLKQLDDAKIQHRVARLHENNVMLEARVPGRRYEIQAFADGRIEVEVYTSDGQIRGQEALDELCQNKQDPSDAS